MPLKASAFAKEPKRRRKQQLAPRKINSVVLPHRPDTRHRPLRQIKRPPVTGKAFSKKKNGLESGELKC